MSKADQLELREFGVADTDALWSLRNIFQATDDSLEVWRQRVSSPPAGAVAEVFQTASLEGQVVGFVRLARTNPDVLNLSLAMREEWRGLGIGSRLWEHLQRQARAFAASRWQVTARNPSPTSLRFLEQRGFTVRERSVYSHLSLPATVDTGLIAQLEARGYRFCTLRAAGDTPANREKLYWLVREAVIDDPGFEGEFETLEQFDQLADAWYWNEAETRYLAIHGDGWVALSGLHPKPDQPFIESGLTGVTKNHRGRGLAQAVKLMTIADAFRRGYGQIRTNNDSRNAAMLAINRKLGFEAVSEFFWLERKNSPV